MIVDVRNLFEKNILNIREIIKSVYPNGKLDSSKMVYAFSTISGINNALSICLKSRLGFKEDNKRDINSDWCPSQLEKEEDEGESFFNVLNDFLFLVEECYSFYCANGDSSAHGQLLKINGACIMMISFLKFSKTRSF